MFWDIVIIRPCFSAKYIFSEAIRPLYKRLLISRRRSNTRKLGAAQEYFASPRGVGIPFQPLMGPFGTIVNDM